MNRQNTPSASARPQRQPVGQRNKLKIRNMEEGYSYRIVNDGIEGRVDELLDAGYEIVPMDKVKRDGDRRVDNASALGSVSSLPLGRGDKGVVMRLKDEWRQQDLAAKQALADGLDQDMKDTATKGSDYGSFSVSVGKK